MLPVERIQRHIYSFRGQNVMLSTDLARLYGVEHRALNQAVSRNAERFPRNFMFQLNREEFGNLKSQFVISSWGGARRARPYACTEEGVAMLSAVLRSPTAISVSIQIMRVFVRLRRFLALHNKLRRKLQTLERKLQDHDQQFVAVFEAISQLMEEESERRGRPRIGYHTEHRDSSAES